jgi:hypothetical protein
VIRGLTSETAAQVASDRYPGASDIAAAAAATARVVGSLTGLQQQQQQQEEWEKMQAGLVLLGKPAWEVFLAPPDEAPSECNAAVDVATADGVLPDSSSSSSSSDASKLRQQLQQARPELLYESRATLLTDLPTGPVTLTDAQLEKLSDKIEEALALAAAEAAALPGDTAAAAGGQQQQQQQQQHYHPVTLRLDEELEGLEEQLLQLPAPRVGVAANIQDLFSSSSSSSSWQGGAEPRSVFSSARKQEQEIEGEEGEEGEQEEYDPEYGVDDGCYYRQPAVIRVHNRDRITVQYDWYFPRVKHLRGCLDKLALPDRRSSSSSSSSSSGEVEDLSGQQEGSEESSTCGWFSPELFEQMREATMASFDGGNINGSFDISGSKTGVAGSVLQGITLGDPYLWRGKNAARKDGFALADPQRPGTTYNRLSSSTRLSSSSSSSSSDPLQGYFLGPVFLRRSEPQLLQLQRGLCPDTGKQMLLGVAVTGNSVCPAGEVVIK